MKRISWYKSFIIFFGIGFLISFLSLVPTILSKGSGKYLFLTLLNKETGLTCHVDELSLSWFGPQSAKKIKIFGKNKEAETFIAEKIDIQGSLVRLLLYRQPKGIHVSGWHLEVDETLSIDNPSVENLDPGACASYLKNSSVLLEHGSITMHTIRGTTLTLSGFYFEKTPHKLIIKGLIKERETTGRILVESSFAPKVDILAQLDNVPLSFFKLFITSSFFDRILSEEEAINLQATAEQDNGQILMTVKAEGSETKANLKGYIHNSSFHIIEGSGSFIELQPKISSFWCSEFLSLPGRARSDRAYIRIEKANIPLDIARWKHSELSANMILPEIYLDTPDPNLSIQMNDIEVGIKKTSRFLNVRGASTLALGGSSQSHVRGFLSMDSKKKKTTFYLHQDILPHTYIRALFPAPLSINLPLEVSYYSLEMQGENKNGHILMDVLLNNPLLKMSCSFSGTWPSLLFQGQGSYYLTENLKKKFSQNFSHVETIFSGKMQILQHLYFPKLSGKISAGENELFFHAKLGKPNEPITRTTCSSLIHGKIFLFPLRVISSKLAPLQMTKGTFSLHTDGSKSLAKGNLQILIEDPENPTLTPSRILLPNLLISCADSSKDIAGNNIALQASGEVIDFPIDRLLKLQNKEAKLSTYVGVTGDMSFSIHYNTKDEDRLVLLSSFKTEALKGDVKLVMDEDMLLSSKTEGTLEWEVSPERYQSFFSNASCLPSCLLHRTATTRLEISKISCADQKTGLSCLSLLTEGGFSGYLTSSPLIFYDHTSKDTFIINNFSGSLKSNNLDTKIEYDLKGTCLSATQDHKLPAELSIQGSFEHLLTPSQRIFLQNAEWQNIPSSFITGIFPISRAVKTKISSLAGPRIHVFIKNEISQGTGPVTIKVDSANLQAYIPLVLTEKAILLNDNLTATLQINEEINKAFLQEFNPLISGSAYSQYPVLLHVSKENFYLPIRPYSFEEFRIQSAFLDFGKISIANSGTMYDLFQFLDIEENKQFVESWFTPIFFSVQKGSIICKRFDALIDNRIRLALWGKTDIIRDQIHMTLGIDPEVIKKYFHNTSLKTKNFFLIKIRGSIASPEFDWSSAYARIALLKSYTIAGPFNSLADKLFSSLGDSTPPQTVSPLPWEEEKENEKAKYNH
ncbi:putative transmembrane protein [Chlamydia ibidis]|uniref:Transmembrane protein n=2 Tax=Chlamydia ibidis TaxID=1405396 RepID=A0ABP2XEL3_9CHLA|nr:hypothetical protein [Chlamydia ibidis]EPP35553.1 putative transmembrane protein [Chlamydia ibidis]EQM62740.1 putative transmembrane protein [Chlamydia ibidis 10-1398/6]